MSGKPAARQGDMTLVSYTHLRAHETVLELVCRLLLEKKKKGLKFDHDRREAQVIERVKTGEVTQYIVKDL